MGLGCVKNIVIIMLRCWGLGPYAFEASTPSCGPTHQVKEHQLQLPGESLPVEASQRVSSLVSLSLDLPVK